MKCLMQAWEQHEVELRGWLRRRLANPADAEDMLQNLFLKTLRQQKAFCQIDNARAWLFAIARNMVIDKARSGNEPLELPDDLAAPPPPAPAAVERLTACLPQALAALTPTDRAVITCCDLDGMTQVEFARQHNLSIPGVKSRLQRARKRLRAGLEIACQVRFDAAGQVCCFVPCASDPPAR